MFRCDPKGHEQLRYALVFATYRSQASRHFGPTRARRAACINGQNDF